MTFRRLHLLIAAGLATLAATAGCGNGLVTSSPGADPSVTEPSTATPSPSAPATSAAPSPSVTRTSAGPTPTSRPSPPSGPTAGAVSACTLSDLTVGMNAAAGGGAAGSNYVLLTFKNRSTTSCTLYGYPGVAFVGKQNGTQLGVPAVRNRNASRSTVRLTPGATTTSLLQIVNAGNYDAAQCAPTTSDGFRVYPPGSRTAAYVPFQTQACQRDPGSSKQLSVSPVGTSG